MELETLKSVLALIEGTDVVEVELQEAGTRMRVRRAERVVPPAAPSQSPAQAQPVPAASAPSHSPQAAAEPTGSFHQLKSPIVGTYYRAPDPTAPPFVKVGDVVRKGQVLCIVEAMKLMNEIESDVAGEVTVIHAESGHPVQFGEPLFTIRTA